MCQNIYSYTAWARRTRSAKWLESLYICACVCVVKEGYTAEGGRSLIILHNNFWFANFLCLLQYNCKIIWWLFLWGQFRLLKYILNREKEQEVLPPTNSFRRNFNWFIYRISEKLCLTQEWRQQLKWEVIHYFYLMSGNQSEFSILFQCHCVYNSWIIWKNM